MDFEITTEGAGEIEMFLNKQEDIELLPKLPSQCFTFKTDHGDFRFLNYTGNGFTISFNDYFFEEPIILKGRSSVPLLELNIQLSYSFFGTWDGIAQPVLLPGQFQLYYAPFVKTRAQFLGGITYKSCGIHFELPFLYELAKDYPILADFLDQATKGELPVEFSPRKHICSQEMLRAIRFIQKNPYSSRVQERLIRYKIEEILIAAIEEAEEESILPAAVKLLIHEEDGLRALKEFIESSPIEFPSISELSKKYGINRDKLKKGFRQLFGESIYDSYKKAKLEKAAHLLLTTNKSIVEISNECGYNHDTAFTNAFKKMYLCTPTDYRKFGRSGR